MALPAQTLDGLALPSTSDLMRAVSGVKIGDPARYRDLFDPLATERAALSPDGRRLAYPVREEDELYIHILDIDHPEELTARVLVMRDRDANLPITNWEFTAANIDWMRWLTTDRLIFLDNKAYLVSFPIPSGSARAPVFGDLTAINYDGTEPLTLVTARRFVEFGSGALHPSNTYVVGFGGEYGKLVVMAAADKSFSSYLLDPASAEKKLVNHERVTRWQRELLDGEGRGRIVFGLRYDHRVFKWESDSTWTKERPMDDTTGLSGFSFSPENYFGERSVPLGFNTDGTVFYFASNIGRDTYGIYTWDRAKSNLLPGTLESSYFDLYSPIAGGFEDVYTGGVDYPEVLRPFPTPRLPTPLFYQSPQLVMDRFDQQLAGVRYEATVRTAVWYRPELQEVQAWLAEHRPGRVADILEWDRDLNRFLVLEQGPADPGAFYVLDRSAGTYAEFVRRGHAPEAGSIARIVPFKAPGPEGGTIDGLLALPKESRLAVIPLVLMCPDKPWLRRGGDYRREFEALTRMGVAVAIYNGRGTWGTGIKERERLFDGYETVQVADLVAVADHLADTWGVARKRVALFGQEHGGFVALRALQLHPDRFRCGVTVDALIDPGSWLAANRYVDLVRAAYGDEAHLKAKPLVKSPETITAPVFVLATRGLSQSTQHLQFLQNKSLYRAVERNASGSEFYEIQPVGQKGEAHQTATQWARIESFLNENLYNYEVDVGDTEVVKEP